MGKPRTGTTTLLVPEVEVNANIYGLTFFLLGFTALSLEIVLTRLFSFILYHDFVFLTLSFAVMGVGLGAALSPFIAPPRSGRFPLGLLAVYGLTVPLPMVLIPFLPAEAMDTSVWLTFGFCSLPPYFMMGLLAGHIYGCLPRKSGSFFFYDLCGAGLGTLAAVPGIDLLGPYPYLFLLTALIFISVIVIQYKETGGISGAMAGLAVVATGFTAFPVEKALFEGPLLDRVVPGKPLFSEMRPPGTKIEETRWTSFGRIDRLSEPGKNYKLIYSDGGVPATMYEYTGNSDSLQALRRTVAYAPFTYGKFDRVLSMGCGAGYDCLLGHLAGVKEMTAVEVNGDLAAMVRRQDEYNGGVYDLPGVTAVVDEGRAFARSSKEKYDLILLLLAQGSGSEGGRVMMEQFLLTQEAFGEYLDHLEPGGRICVAVHNPHRASRYFTSFAAIEKSRGVNLQGAVRRFALLSYPDAAYRFFLIFHKDIPDEADLRRLAAFADSTDAEPIFIPLLHEEDKDLGGMARGEVSMEEFIRSSPGGINIEPATDDRPFQNDVFYGLHPALKRLFRLSIVLLVLLIGISLVIGYRRKNFRVYPPFALFFACTGAGFMIAEVIFMRKLMLYLGHPTLSITVVLFSILIFAGLGGRFCQREILHGRWWILRLAPFVLALILFFYFKVSGAMMDRVMMLPVAARSGMALLLLSVPGFLMGIPFPAGMARAGRTVGFGVPLFWSINGIASVVGTITAIALSISYGLTSALWAAAGCYLAAGLLFLRRK